MRKLYIPFIVVALILAAWLVIPSKEYRVVNALPKTETTPAAQVTPVTPVAPAPIKWIEDQAKTPAPVPAYEPKLYTAVDEYGKVLGTYPDLDSAKAVVQALPCSGAVWFDGKVVATHVHYPFGPTTDLTKDSWQ